MKHAHVTLIGTAVNCCLYCESVVPFETNEST